MHLTPGTAKRGQALATTRKWQNLSGNERALWGECKSSGTKYYQTYIDLKGPAFKCNCPSFKFPCKHAMGLLLIYVNNSSAFRITHDYPPPMVEWLQKRGKKEVVNAPEVSEADLQKKRALKEKNKAKRLAEMQAGADDLEIWLFDLIRNGLASSQGQSLNYWNDIAVRMVDSKLGGIAKKIRSLPLLQGANTEWPAKLLAHLSEIYLIVKGIKRLEDLPKPLQETLLSIAGLNLKKDDLLNLPKIKDQWQVLGQLEGVEERLNFRRTWLMGTKTKKIALILDYSFGDAGFEQQYMVGSTFGGSLIYYPSSFPLRAFTIQQDAEITMVENFNGYDSFEEFSVAYANALFANPWLLDFPVCFEKCYSRDRRKMNSF